MVALARLLGTTWHSRAIAAAIVSVVALVGFSIDALFLPLAVMGPALPFTAMGIADGVAPRAAWTAPDDQPNP